MILEVGAGGCILITPPAEKTMTNKKDPITVAFESAPVDNYVRYPRDIPKRDEDGDIVIKGDVHSYSIVYEHRRGDIVLNEDGQPLLNNLPGYKRYKSDVYVTGPDGKIVTDVNGNKIVQAKAGDIQFNEFGEPLKDWKNCVPRVVFAGIRDGQQYHPCRQHHVSDIDTMDTKDFNYVFEEVQKEAQRRLNGGKPIEIGDNPHVVASI